MGARRWIGGRPVLAFVLIAFGWTWGWYAIYFAFDLWGLIPVAIPDVWGPAIGALVVVWAREVPVLEWLRRRLDWRVTPALFVLALAIPLVITNVQPFVEAIGGGTVVYDPPGELPRELHLAIGLSVVFVLVQTFVLGGSEELGWRGVLQPRLQRRLSVFTTGLVIGVLWWAWHLPLFASGHPFFEVALAPFIAYTLFIIGASTVLGALANATGGSVLPVMVMHGTANLGAFFTAHGGFSAGSWLVPILVGAGLWWAIAAVLVARYGLSMSPVDRSIAVIDPKCP